MLVQLAFCQPASAAIYKVPKKIRDNCSVPVDKQIVAWLATVPDGNTAQFGSGRCYGQDGTIVLPDRAGLTIDGGGSEFRALTKGDSHRAKWRITGGWGLTVQNVAYGEAIHRAHTTRPSSGSTASRSRACRA